MPIFILGLVFTIGLFVYYLVSTSVSKDDDKPTCKRSKPEETIIDDENIKKEENVIFLPDDIEWIKEKYKRKK